MWAYGYDFTMAMKRIVVIGGGTGTFTVLQALRDAPVELTAIVSTADDGGSTGILRDELGVLPPGDLRQALVALASDSTMLRELFNYRFDEGCLKGHNFGNLLISALEKITGSFDSAILEAGKILAIRGRVIPVTMDQMRLLASTRLGETVHGEQAIDEHIWDGKACLERFWIESACEIHPLARQAILKADLVLIGPGSIYTSLIPCLLVDGVKEALRTTRAKVAYIANLMTERGQAGDYFVQDFIELIERYIGKGQIDYALYNKRMPSAELLDTYRRERERKPVRIDPKRVADLRCRLIGTSLVCTRPPKQTAKGDALASTRTLIRHDGARLARALTALLYLQEAEQYL